MEYSTGVEAPFVGAPTMSTLKAGDTMRKTFVPFVLFFLSIATIAQAEAPRPVGFPSNAELRRYMTEMPSRLLRATLRQDGRVALDSIQRLELIRQVIQIGDLVSVSFEHIGRVSDVRREVCAAEYEALCGAYGTHEANEYIAYLYFANGGMPQRELLPYAQYLADLVEDVWGLRPASARSSR